MRRSFQFQIMRSKRTKHLDSTTRVACSVWNHCVALHRRYYRLFGKTLNKYQLSRHLTKIKKLPKFQFWTVLDAQTIGDVIERLYRGWNLFFKHIIKRPPTFRGWRKYTSFTLRQSGWKLIGNGKIRIQDRIYRFHQHREILGTIKTVTIHRDTTGRHYVTFSCDNVPQPAPLVKTGKAAGVDFGLKTFLTLSTGEKIESPQPLKAALRDLKKAGQKLSRKQKGSKSRKKAKLELANVHRKVTNQRDYFHWQTATQLVKEFDELAFEDLSLAGMKALWGRKVGDLGFGNFLLKTKWLASKYGRLLEQCPRFEPTTKRMSCCGNVQPVALDERTVTCLQCGTSHDRDINAAISILEACRRLRPGAECKTSPQKEAVCVITAESL